MLSSDFQSAPCLLADLYPILLPRLQVFIAAHRSSIQAKSDPPLTFHGLRHTFAAEKYKELMDSGMGALDAHFTVSRLLGHERADVTNVYLASLSTKGMKDKH